MFKDYSSNSSSFSLFFQHIQNKGYRIYTAVFILYYGVYVYAAMPRPYVLFPIEAAARFRTKGYVLVIDRLVGGIARSARAGLTTFLNN